MQVKRIIVGLAALALVWGVGFTAAHAQVSYGVRVCSPDYTSRCIKPNTNGSINVVGGSGDGGPVTIVDGGDVTEGAKADAACATDSGTCTVKAMIGRTNARLTTINTTLGTPAQAGAALSAGTAVIGGTFVTPSSASGSAITPVVSSTAETGHVLKASAGNLYSLVVTTGAAAGYVMVHNSTTVPAAGAVTPLMCVQVPANSSIAIGSEGEPPSRYSTGISASFSTAGCFTQTDSATAYFSGKVQ